MEQRLVETLKNRAHFVAGRNSRIRDDSDPLVEIAVGDATIFLDSVEKEMGIPNISGGTSTNPRDILTLYWLVRETNRIVGIYVTFNGDHTGNVSWNEPDGSVRRLDAISVEKLLNLDIPGKFQNLCHRLSGSKTIPTL